MRDLKPYRKHLFLDIREGAVNNLPPAPRQYITLTIIDMCMKPYTLTLGYFEFAGRPGSIHFADMRINRPVCRNMIPATQPRHQHRKLKIMEVGGARVCERGEERGLTDLKERIGARDDHGLRARADADCVKEWPHKYERIGLVVRFRLHCNRDRAPTHVG